MGQAANSNRQAKLDDKKSRAAGRMCRKGQHNPEQESIRDALDVTSTRGKIDGAFGKDGRANSHLTKPAGSGSGGGGGGNEENARAAAKGVGRSTRPARKS